MSTLYCKQCKQNLDSSKFSDEQILIDNDDERTCMKCYNADLAKFVNPSSKPNDKTNDEGDNDENDNKSTSPPIEQQQTERTTDLRLYPDTKTKRWVKAIVQYEMDDGQTLVTLYFGDKSQKDMILSVEDSNKLIKFNQSMVGEICSTDNTIPERVAIGSGFSETLPSTTSTMKTVHGQSLPQLDKYMKIYNELKRQNIDNTVGDDTLKMLARDEYIRSQQQTTSTKPHHDYSEMVYRELRMKPFKGTFPKNDKQYWEYSHEVDRFRKEFLGIPDERLLEEILQSHNSEVRSSWNQYTEDQYNEIKVNYTDDQLNDPTVPLRLRQTFNTIANYESFVIGRLDFNPDIVYFNKVLLNIHYGRNEMPLWFDQRLQRYWNNIRIVKERLNSNPNLTCNIRKYTDQEQLEQYIRACIHDNNTPDYNNDGVLNQRVKLKISTWIQKQSEITLDNFRQMLQTLHTNILPAGCGNNNPDGLSWKRFRFSGSVFQVWAPRKTSNKRKVTFADGGKPPKRRRVDETTNKKKPCKQGIACRYYLSNRGCRYRHTSKQMKIMDEKRKQTSSQNPSVSNTWSTPKNLGKKHGGQKQWLEKCKYGSKCGNLYRGACPYYHPWKDKICSYCKTRGHFEFNCRLKNKAKRAVQRYNPMVNANPTPPNPHTISTPHALALTTDGIQFINGEPYQKVSRYEKVGDNTKNVLPIKNIDDDNRLSELKDIQRSAQKQITAILKNKDVSSSAYEEFMAKANKNN